LDGFDSPRGIGELPIQGAWKKEGRGRSSAFLPSVALFPYTDWDTLFTSLTGLPNATRVFLESFGHHCFKHGMVDFLVTPGLFENVLQGRHWQASSSPKENPYVFFPFLHVSLPGPRFLFFFCSRSLFVPEDCQSGPAQIGRLSGIVFECQV